MSELTFTNADDLLRHYADVRKRLNAGPTTPIPDAAPMAHIETAEAAAMEATPAHTMVDQALAPLVVGASNIIAVTMLRRLLLDDLPGRLLYLYGPEGTGKTLMATLARKVLPPTRLRLVDRAETAAPFECSRVMGGVIRGLAFGRNPPSECQGGEALARAVSVEIDLPCPEVRLGVLRREASRLSRGVGQDVLAALAEADVPLPSALGTLRTLVMTARQVDVASAMELLERARVPAGPRRVKIDDIQQVVCQHYGISRADNNAFTKYIGQSDESLGASQRLIVGLNALADNFDTTADVVLKVAGIIAAALVGRAIGGMIASLGLGVTALVRFAAALRAAATVGGLATALGGLSAAAGPIGLVIGGAVVGALALFSSSSQKASDGARTYAAALKGVEEAAKAVAPAIDGATASISSRMANQLTAGIAEGVRKIDEAKSAAVDLFSTIIDNAPRRLITDEQLSGLEDLRDGLRDGTVGAKEASERLYALANGNPNFQRLADQMAPLLETLANAIAATKSLKSELSGVAAPSFREAENASMSSYDKMATAGQQFVADATKRANLTKDQLALEKEIAEVRKEAAAVGVTLSDTQVSSLAQTRLAGDAARTAEGKAPKAIKATADSRFDQDLQYVRDRTAALVAEQEVIGQGLAAQESRRVQLDLETQALADLREEARRKGETDLASIQLAPDQVAAIKEVADAYGEQSAALARAQQAYGDFNDLGRSAVGSIASDIKNGVSAADALANALDRVADKLIDMAVNSIFDTSSGGGLGGLIGGLGKLLGFDEGGYTGDGGKRQPAGVVHRGEFVFSKSATKKAGAGNLEAMHRRLKGYASGGLVGSAMPALRAPTLPRLSAGGAARGSQVQIGVSVDDDGKIIAYVKREAGLAERRGAVAGAAAAVQRTPGIAIGSVVDNQKRRMVR